MINRKLIAQIIGVLLGLESLFLLFALIVSLIYNEDDSLAFVLSIVITFAVGLLFYLLGKDADSRMSKRDAYIIVSAVWVIFSFFGALPFFISGYIPSFTDAFFETISGFTTTGASILTDIEALPHGLLFWRSFTQWIGGMGIIVLSLALLPIFGIGGMQLFAAEVPGPTADKISPRVKDTAIRLWGIYILFTVLEMFLLWLGGMSFYDAINHAFTTMATGGYSTRQASIAYWDSPFIHYVIIVFMFLAGTNFSLSFMLLRGQFGKLKENEEFKYYLGFTLGAAIIITIILLALEKIGVEKAFRDSLFQVVSIITTTGYATVDYCKWPSPLVALIFLLMFFGGSAGSTGGGIKIARVVVVLKNINLEFKRLIHPQAIVPVRLNKKSIDPAVVNNIMIFVLAYMAIFLASTVIMSFMGLDLRSAMGAVAATLGNIGPGLGSVGPAANYAHIPGIGKWLLSFLMLIGRLELFTVLVLLSPAFWRK